MELDMDVVIVVVVVVGVRESIKVENIQGKAFFKNSILKFRQGE